jgi:hypothetical protein
MAKTKVNDDFGYVASGRGAYQSDPVLYPTTAEGRALEITLWHKSLDQITAELQDGNYDNLEDFLHLYNCVKDPVSPIAATLPDQVEIFISLYEEAMASLPANEYSREQTKAFVVQLALESSFLALPAAKNIVRAHYSAHHELPYIHIEIEKLPRGEFASPVRVVEITQELLDQSKTHGETVATPIAVSQFQTPGNNVPEMFIVDGNNRATAILIMKYFDYVNFDKGKIRQYEDHLPEFVNDFGLDVKWERDIAMALSLMVFIEDMDLGQDPVGLNKKVDEYLVKHNLNDEVWRGSVKRLFEGITQKPIDVLLDNKTLVQEYAHAQIPALLVQEPSFHTIACSLSEGEKITLLQPMHQAIYNENDSEVAVPSKRQTHGRVDGNRKPRAVRSVIT